MNTGAKPLAEINDRAIQILYKHMGVVDTIRFLNQFTMGHGDYTKERREWLDGLSLDDAVAAIKSQRE